jgi:hypothetical protein
LGFAVPYFIDSVNRGEEKSFFTFFHVYKALLPYLGAKLFGMLVAIICLMPLFFSLYNLLNEFQFDINFLINEIQNDRVELPSSSKIKIAVSLFLMISTLPFYIFLEYFLILSDDPFEMALKKSYHIGVRYYFNIIGLFILAFVLMFLGVATCVFGLIVAIPIIYSMFYFSYNQFKNDFSSNFGKEKSQLKALLLFIFLGGFAAHRWYLGKSGLINILYILSAGGIGIWAIIDLIRLIKGDLKPIYGEYKKTL